MSTFVIKQVRSVNGVERQAARHAALARPAPDRPDGRAARLAAAARAWCTPCATSSSSRRSRDAARGETDDERGRSASTASSRRRAPSATASASAAGTAPATARRPAAATRATAPARAPRTARASRAARTRSTCACASCAGRTRRCRCRSSRSGRTPSRSIWSTWRSASSPAPRSTSTALRAAGLATRRGVPVKVLGKGELTKPLTVHAHKFSKSARAAIEAAGGDLPGPRALGERARRGGDDPQLVPGPGDPQEARLHGGAARALPARLVHPRAGRLDRGAQAARGPVRRARTSSASSTCSRAAGCRGSPSSRWASCPTSPPRSSCSC